MAIRDVTTVRGDSNAVPARQPSRPCSFLTLLGAGVFAGGLALLPAPAVAQLAPQFLLTADGFEVPMTITTQGDETGKIFLFQGNYLDNTISTSLSGISNADPFILWSFAATNATANPVSFVLTMVQPVVGGPYDRVVNGFSGSVTDLAGDGVSASTVANFVALFPGGFIGGSLLGGNCGYAGPNGPGFSGVCPVAPDTQFGPAITPVPAGAYLALATQLAFTLSSLDSAAFSGVAVLDATSVIPVPATLPLLASGLAIGMLAWRRRNS